MTKPEQIAALLAELESNGAVLPDTVDRVGDQLRAGGFDGDEMDAVGARLLALAGHPRWQVRKSVAHAIQHLRHESFQVAVARLLDDDNAWVQEAARKALARRSELTHADALKEQHGDLLMEWLGGLEGQHGPRARDAAMRVGQKYTELLVREAYHEIVKIISPLDVSLTNLGDALGRHRIDRDACQKHVRRARERLQLLTSIVTSLRDVTMEVTPEFRGEDLHAVVDEAVGLVWDAMRRQVKKIKLAVEIDRGLVVDLHRHRIVQALGNVIQNAVESFDGVDGTYKIEIVAHSDRDRAVVAVTDNGCGMSEEAVTDAFRLFTTRKPNGTGFGLPLARKVIESEHHGSIRLTSAKERGTTVTIALPLEQEA